MIALVENNAPTPPFRLLLRVSAFQAQRAEDIACDRHLRGPGSPGGAAGRATCAHHLRHRTLWGCYETWKHSHDRGLLEKHRTIVTFDASGRCCRKSGPGCFETTGYRHFRSLLEVLSLPSCLALPTSSALAKSIKEDKRVGYVLGGNWCDCGVFGRLNFRTLTADAPCKRGGWHR